MAQQIPPDEPTRLPRGRDACWVVRPIEYVSDSPSPDTSIFDKDPKRLQLAWLSALTLLEQGEDPAIVKERGRQAEALIKRLDREFPA